MDTAELLAILIKARENNSGLSVSGMLLYRGGNFLQVLEGDRGVVKSLFNRIATDPRHRQVSLIMEHPVSERNFPGWAMGFKNLDNVDLTDLPGYTPFLDVSFNSEQFRDAGFAYTFLKMFKDKMR